MASLTGNSPRREQRLQSLMLDRLVFRHERRIAREIRRAMSDAAKLIRAGSSAQYAAPDHQQKLKSIIFTMYRETAETFANYLGARKSAKLNLKQEGQFVPATPIVDRIMAEWAENFGSEHIKLISDTTRADIQRIVSNGITEGLSEKDIAKMIAEVAPTKSASRAQTIARTETHAASQATSLETAKDIGVEMTKSWVHGGPRTRESHIDAGNDESNQNIGIDDLFQVGSDRLRYPGDPSGSPEEIINCRCIVTYDIL